MSVPPSAARKAVYFLSPSAFDRVFGPEEQAALAARVEITGPLLTEESYLSTQEAWPEVEIIFSGWGMPAADAAFLDRFPRLRAIFHGAGSIKSFATPEMWRRGIRVTSAAQANAVPVSEFALSQILFSLKQGWQQALFIREHGCYPPPSDPPGAWTSTVGLISLGMIGRLVAERLRSFDVRVIAYDPVAPASLAERLHVEIVSLEEIFSRSDVVSCHAPLLPETEKMIGARHFAAMKPAATFLNTARGAVVDEAGLVQVLQSRPDLMAVLDVTWPEPPPEGSPLYSLGNVVLTPHIAGSLGLECRRMGRAMVGELDLFLANKPMLHEVDEARSALLA